MKAISGMIMLLFALDTSAQSLADVARKERERQRQAKSAVSVVSPPQGAAARTAAGTAATTVAPAAVPAPGPAGPTDNKGRDEKYWRGQFQGARDALKRAEDKVAVLDLKLKDLHTQLLQRSDIYNREVVIGAEIAKTREELDQARKDADAAKQKIAGLEEELRRSGGLPGWAR